MVSELGPSEYIQEFVSRGPKNYAYKIINKTTGKDKTVCKVRGFTLYYSAKHLVNFDVIRNMILNPEDNDTVTVRTEKRSSARETHVMAKGLVYRLSHSLKTRSTECVSPSDAD
jgi:hypothetical protein